MAHVRKRDPAAFSIRNPSTSSRSVERPLTLQRITARARQRVPTTKARAERVEKMIVLYALAAALGLGALGLGTTLRVVKQFERGVVFRFGRV